MSEWYAVRCVFQWERAAGAPFEERITLWRAAGPAEAVEVAQREAARYAEENDVTHRHLAQAYALGEAGELGSGAEVFPARDSPLEPQGYVTTYFDTGTEHQADLEP
ncbi:hypothetical protein QRX50_42125 [Amycolatopsis carbonis]|uniref:DUF4288 domain-containing protein n=1 Tax=Amycolatopsis carbonis TaxID=715471 RepID=A0A9Y2IEC4_9PSEU|nr:hypothetical protein [Amycolatopsis sp. 2-15]WIX77929.1 hypothetical protein QRX50_42125 [Amycolatopsis sp. 2-15]